jgi:hypothetical protein
MGVRRKGEGEDLMRTLLILLVLGALACASAPARASAPRACPEEDSPAWNWVRCGNGYRGVVTMWGTEKVVSCGEFRWLARHADLDPRTPWIVGDYSCGRRHSQDSVLNY